MSTWTFRLLGTFEAHYCDELIVGPTKARPRALLAYLLLHRDRQLTRHGLADVFWPDSKVSQARTNLRNLLHRIRESLPEPASLIHQDKATVGIREDADLTLDVDRFLTCVHAVEDGVSEPLALLEEAHALVSGILLPGCRDEWVFPLREQIKRMAGEVADDLATAYEESGERRRAIRVSREALLHNPHTESLHRRLIRLLAVDDRASALRAYHACADVLAMVGTTPSSGMEELVAGLRARKVATRRDVRKLPFVGRDAEQSSLITLVEALEPGMGRVVAVVGEAGLGKTRLCEEVVRWADTVGTPTGWARAYRAGGQLEYAPVAEWLRSETLRPRVQGVAASRATEVSRLLPELLERMPGLAAPSPLVEDWQRARFHLAVTEVVRGAEQPLVLVLDDAQWADGSTLAWLHGLVRFVGGPFLLLLTIRPGEAGDEGLAVLRQGLIRDGLWSELMLSPLSAGESQALVSAAGLAPELRDQVCEQSEGSPLFLVELARMGAPGRLPDRLQSVIEGRLGTLDDAALQLARVASLVGQEVSWETLIESSEMDAAAVADALDDLWERGILRERGAGTYGFGHDLIRESVVSTIPPGTRRRVHGRIADALVRTGAPWVRVANHREAAGQPGAVEAHLEAARSATRVFANEQGVFHLERVLVLGGPRHRIRPVASLALAEILQRIGRHREARKVLGEALVLREIEPLDRVRLEYRLALSASAQSHYPLALASLDAAEAALGAIEAPTLEHRRAGLDLRLARTHVAYWVGDSASMAAIEADTADDVRAHGSPEQRAVFHMGHLSRLHRRDRYDLDPEDLALGDLALAAARETGDERVLGEALFLQGFTLLWANRLEAAERLLLEAQRSAVRIGDLWLQLRCKTYQAFLARLARLPELEAYVDGAAELATRLELPAYRAVAMAHRAVMRLRDGDRAGSLALALQAVETWDSRSVAYPFQWCARLVVVAVRPECVEEQALVLRDHGQHRLPVSIDTALGAGDAATVVAEAQRLVFL